VEIEEQEGWALGSQGKLPGDSLQVGGGASRRKRYHDPEKWESEYPIESRRIEKQKLSKGVGEGHQRKKGQSVGGGHLPGEKTKKGHNNRVG